MEAHLTHADAGAPLAPPARPLRATGPRVLLGALGPALLARLRAWGREATVRDAGDLAALTGVTVVGSVPHFGARPRQGFHARPRPDAPATGAYLALRGVLRAGPPRTGARVVVLTSARSGDGKTTSAANLAMVMARAGDRVLLIDAETRRGDQHAVFGVPAEPGFFDLLYGQSEAAACIHTLAVGGGAHLDLLPSGGASQANAEELLMAGRLRSFLDGLRPRYDVILVDSPPLESFADAARLGAVADDVLLVARVGRTPRRVLAGAVRQLRHASARLTGAVLNDVARRA